MMLSVNIEKKINGRFLVRCNSVFECGVHGLFGPSGCGKTTLLKMIAGLVKPDRGVIEGDMIYYCKENSVMMPAYKRNIGYVFQDSLLFPYMNIRKNLLFSPRANKESPVFDQVVKLLHIDHLLENFPANLSGGEAQRCSIGRALLSEPKILLLDEPFSALDNRRRFMLMPYISMIAKNFKIPVIVVSHELADLRQLDARIIFMKHGFVYDMPDTSDRKTKSCKWSV